MTELEEKLFRKICYHSQSGICFCWYPIPATFFVRTEKLSYYKALKTLHSLRDMGLVTMRVYNHFDDYDGRYHLVRGWEPTSEGLKHPICLEEIKRIEKEFEEWLKQNQEMENQFYE